MRRAFSLCLYRTYNTNAKMNAVAWRRQWLPQWLRQINHHHIAAGHAVSATTTLYLIAAARSPCRSMTHQCFLSSAAAAGDHDRSTGDKGVSPPKPRASSSWGDKRRSYRLKQKNTTMTIRPIPTVTIQPRFLRSFDRDNLRALEKTMDKNNLRALEEYMGNAQHKSVRQSLPNRSDPRSAKNSHFIPNNHTTKYNPEIAKILAKINGCKTIDDIVQIAHDNLDNLPPNVTAAFWKRLSSLLNHSSKHGMNDVSHFGLVLFGIKPRG